MKSVAYLINHISFGVIGFQIPQNKMESLLSTPHLLNLKPRVFGCMVYAHIPKVMRSKLDPFAKQCVLVGYSKFQKGYRCYDPQHQKLHVTMDTSFQELEPYYSRVHLGLLFRRRITMKKTKIYLSWRKMEGPLKEILREHDQVLSQAIVLTWNYVQTIDYSTMNPLCLQSCPCLHH